MFQDNLFNNYSIKNDRKNICLVRKFFLYNYQKDSFWKQKVQFQMILLENCSNLIEKTWLFSCIYIDNTQIKAKLMKYYHRNIIISGKKYRNFKPIV